MESPPLPKSSIRSLTGLISWFKPICLPKIHRMMKKNKSIMKRIGRKKQPYLIPQVA